MAANMQQQLLPAAVFTTVKSLKDGITLMSRVFIFLAIKSPIVSWRFIFNNNTVINRFAHRRAQSDITNHRDGTISRIVQTCQVSRISRETHAFLSRVSILTRDIDIPNMSVCLSVRLSVRYVPVSDENGLTYGHSFFTVR